MSGPHDLGGRGGFGRVPVGDDEQFAMPWEKRAFAVTQFAQVAAGFTTDAFRHGIERESLDGYRTTYFDRWIRNAERMLVEGGVIASDAVTAHLEGTTPQQTAHRTTTSLRGAPSAARTPADPPLFSLGDRVRTLADRETSPHEHTRLPGYVAGRSGTIALVNGGWLLPDANAHGEPERAVWAYSVAFDAAELWPGSAATHRVHVDLFETYLESA